MAISDVLWQAIRDIERYQRDWPDAYDGLRAEIDEVKAAMLEMGQTQPTWETVQALAVALGVDVNAFVTHKPKPVNAEPPKPRGRPRKEK